MQWRRQCNSHLESDIKPPFSGDFQRVIFLFLLQDIFPSCKAENEQFGMDHGV